MKNIFFITLVLSSFSLADSMMHHSHEDMHNSQQHNTETFVDGNNFGVDKERFSNFVKNLSATEVAVVSVQGMVCDFCARGIEKTFKKDGNVISVDVDLNKGKVLIAYSEGSEINFDDIKEKITANGQNATNLEVLTL
jgi:copper chaperone CopZ